MKKLNLLFALLLCSAFTFAQQSLEGKVTDFDGSGLPGINIVEKGTQNGTATDFDGNYTISVGDNATLVYSSVGYAKQEIKVNGKSIINVTMEDGEALEEIVLVG